MTTRALDRDPIMATEAEQDTLASIGRLLTARPRWSPRLVGQDGSEMTLPKSLYAVLVRAVHELHRGNGLAILPVGQELTTQQAAGLLNVSRPYLIRLLESGKMPYHKVGTHRRIRLEDLLVYRRVRSDARRAAFAGLSQDAQDLGLSGVAEDPPVAPPELHDMTERLVRSLAPSRVILFGSWARGDARADSDIDLLVVMPTLADRHRTTVEALRAVAGFERPVDILAAGEDDLASNGSLPGTAIHEALRTGRTVYARG